MDAGLSQQVSKGLIICIKHVVRSLNEPGKNDCVRVMTLYSKQETLQVLPFEIKIMQIMRYVTFLYAMV